MGSRHWEDSYSGAIGIHFLKSISLVENYSPNRKYNRYNKKTLSNNNLDLSTHINKLNNLTIPTPVLPGSGSKGLHTLVIN